MTNQLVPRENQPDLPAILAGNATPAIRNRVEEFFSSIAGIFESWVGRRQSRHTQRAYREDVMAFVKFLGLTWPDQACRAAARLRPGSATLPRPARFAECGAENPQPPDLIALELL
jgi:hypothetical protein